MSVEPEHVGQDGTIRKDHYGEGRQPWDTIVEECPTISDSSAP